MDKSTAYEVTTTTQDQATAGFVDMLKQIRLDNLLQRLMEISDRRDDATAEIERLRADIIKLIDSNRGGIKGVHGFIGERVQVVFCNARAIIQGENPLYYLVDDNGMTDYLRGNVLIQQKACISDKALGLTHVLAHADKYPAFLNQNGVYQIPKDFYEIYIRYIGMSKEAAGKLLKDDYRMWRRVQSFHNAAPKIKVEPMVVTYSEIQAGNVMDSIERETEHIEKYCQDQKVLAKIASRPTWSEGIKVTATSATIEGLVDGGLSLAKHIRQDKRIRDLDKHDWSEIGIDAAKGVGKGAVRGAVTYSATNLLNMPAPIATAGVTAAFGVGKEVKSLRAGDITKRQFGYTVSEVIADTAVSAISSELGKRLIRIPVVGPLVGNAIGIFIWSLGKNIFRKASKASLINMLGGSAILA